MSRCGGKVIIGRVEIEKKTHTPLFGAYVGISPDQPSERTERTEIVSRVLRCRDPKNCLFDRYQQHLPDKNVFDLAPNEQILGVDFSGCPQLRG